MDLQEIVALAKLLSVSVEKIVSLSKDDGEPLSLSDSRVRKYTLQITAAASQIISLVRSPEHYVLETAMSYHISSSLNFAVEIAAPEIIRKYGRGPKHGLHVKEIAGMARVNDVKLARIMRLLATHHIFDEVVSNVFSNNRHSAILDTGKDLVELQARPEERYDGTSGLSALICHVVDDGMNHSTAMSKTLLDPVTSLSFSPLHAPFSRARNTELQMFDWMNLPGNESKLKRFGNAMNGMSGTIPAEAVLKGFDWIKLPYESVVVDVGGGVGAASLPILRSCPSLKLVIQDSAPVVTEALKFWQSHFPEVLEDMRVSFQAQDFFLPQPESSNLASVFLLRLILHNWPDKECITILQHVRAAASPDAKLVIIDNILMPSCKMDEDLDENDVHKSDGNEDIDGRAPPPLLANWGAANKLAYTFDVMMMCNHNAGERTLPEVKALLLEAGWGVQEVYQFHETWLPQIVAIPLVDYKQMVDASPAKTFYDFGLSSETDASNVFDECENPKQNGLEESSTNDSKITTEHVVNTGDIGLPCGCCI